jgi:hypothetical protein
MRAAYADGRLGQQAALLVVQALGRRDAEPALERRWVDSARGGTVKRLRDEVRWARRAVLGDGAARAASDGSDASAARLAPARPGLTFSTPPGRDTAAGRGCVLPPPSDAEWQASLQRDPGASRARIRSWALELADAPEADDVLRLTLPEEIARDFLGAIEAQRQRLAEEARQGLAFSIAPEGDSGEDPVALSIACAFAESGRRVPRWVGLLALLEEFAATWDDPAGHPRRAEDATYRRDGWRCMAPGCMSRRNLEAHHIVHRAHGGNDEPSNLVTLCAFHHRQGEHGGLMAVDGTAPLGLRWRLGPGGEPAEAWFRNERTLAPRNLTPP